MSKKKIEATDLIMFNKMNIALKYHPMSNSRANYKKSRKIEAIEALIQKNQEWLDEYSEQ